MANLDDFFDLSVFHFYFFCKGNICNADYSGLQNKQPNKTKLLHSQLIIAITSDIAKSMFYTLNSKMELSNFQYYRERENTEL